MVNTAGSRPSLLTMPSAVLTPMAIPVRALTTIWLDRNSPPMLESEMRSVRSVSDPSSIRPSLPRFMIAAPSFPVLIRLLLKTVAPETAEKPFIVVLLADTTSPVVFNDDCAIAAPAVIEKKAIKPITFSKLLILVMTLDLLLTFPPTFSILFTKLYFVNYAEPFKHTSASVGYHKGNLMTR